MNTKTKTKSGELPFLLPMFLWTAVFVVLPIAYTVIISFTKSDRNGGYVFTFTFDNYVNLANGTAVYTLRRSLGLAAGTTALTFLLALPFSCAVNGMKSRWRSAVMFLIIIPFWTNSLIRTYGLISLMQGNGFINSALMSMGLIRSPLPLLYNEWAVLFGMVYSFVPFMILPIYAALGRVDRSIPEAARDLGARRFRTFWSVTLPGILPGILSGVVLVFVPSVGMYFISDLMGGGNRMYLGDAIQYYSANGRNRPFAAALSVVMLTLAGIFIAIYRKISGKSEPMGIV